MFRAPEHDRLPPSFNKHHFYILRRTDDEKESYAIGIESGPWNISRHNKPEYQILFYRGVPSAFSRILFNIENYLYCHYKEGMEGGSHFYYPIPYSELRPLVEAEFENLKYVCKCKEFCRREK